MKISPIVLKLRLANTRFEDNIGGTAEFAVAERQVFYEEAFVYQIAEEAGPSYTESVVQQKMTEIFAVTVVLKNDNSDRDKLGLMAYDALHDVRAELWSALLGWEMPEGESKVYFVGGRILKVTRAYLMYQFEFGVDSQICEDEADLTGVDEFNKIYTQYILAPDPTNLPVRGVAPVLTRPAGEIDAEQQIERE